MKVISSCEVCGNPDMNLVLDLGKHPMCDDLKKTGTTDKCAEYPIQVLYCQKCRSAHQRYQLDKEILFPENYHYRAHFTNDVLSGMQNLVDDAERLYGSLAGKRVLDIGCNDGSLLNMFQERGCTTLGVEPTDAAKEARENGHIIYQEYFDSDVSQRIAAQMGPMDLITFTNVFAHIDDLNELLNNLRYLITESTVIIIENHYLGSILKNMQFDTFYHEHPRTYSLTSFLYIAEKLGCRVVNVTFPERYGGNIRVYLCKTGAEAENIPDILKAEEDFFELFSSMRERIQHWQNIKREQIVSLVQVHGKLRAKAFPGRAAILLKMLQIDETQIEAVYEKPGSKKIGYDVPGTRIPIQSDEILFADNENRGPLLNFAWHIPGEIRQYLRQNGYRGEVIDIYDPREL